LQKHVCHRKEWNDVAIPLELTILFDILPPTGLGFSLTTPYNITMPFSGKQLW